MELTRSINRYKSAWRDPRTDYRVELDLGVYRRDRLEIATCALDEKRRHDASYTVSRRSREPNE